MWNSSLAYTCIGSFLVIWNCIIFAIVFSDRLVLRQSAFICGTVFGNLVQSGQIFSLGVFALVHHSLEQVQWWTMNSCNSQIFFLLYPLSSFTMSTFLIMAALERFLAINAGQWFQKIWTPIASWKMASIICGLLLATASVGFGMAVFNLEHGKCMDDWKMSNSIFAVLLHSIVAITAVFSVLVSVLAMVTGACRMRNAPYTNGGEVWRIKKHTQVNKSIVIMAASHLGLVAVPSAVTAVFLAQSFGQLSMAALITPISFYTNGIYSVITMVALIRYNKCFRRAMIKLFHIEIVAIDLKRRFDKKYVSDRVYPIYSITLHQ